MDRHRAAVGAGNYNRFLPIASRSRTPSQKRARLSDSEVHANQVKLPKLDAQVIFEQLKDHDSCMAKAKDALSSAAIAIKAACKEDDGGIGTAMCKLFTAVEQLVTGSENMKSTLVDFCKKQEDTKSISYASKAANKQPPHEQGKERAQSQSRTRKGTSSGATSAEQKVKKQLREAKRKMIIFDLDLGKAPIINKKTISEKVTLSLHAKAKNNATPTLDATQAGTMVDNVLSCASLEFLGHGTRTFYNTRDKTDARNNTFCTVPVRLDFPNKETRTQAEQALRRTCKVKPSTPYPKRLRSMIAEIVKKGKAIMPDTFVRTKVDIENLLLKAMVKDRDTGKWTDLKDLTCAIPLTILDSNVSDQVSELDSDMEVLTQAIASEQSQASL